MSHNKHTPGPWVADDNEGLSMWKIYSRMSPSGSGIPGPFVAKVIGYSAEADANAQLIAAAPELLEALRLFITLYGTDDVTAWQYIRDKAVSAIAKAEGEQL